MFVRKQMRWPGLRRGLGCACNGKRLGQDSPDVLGPNYNPFPSQVNDNGVPLYLAPNAALGPEFPAPAPSADVFSPGYDPFAGPVTPIPAAASPTGPAGGASSSWGPPASVANSSSLLSLFSAPAQVQTVTTPGASVKPATSSPYLSYALLGIGAIAFIAVLKRR